jgi:hypothetical protein
LDARVLFRQLLGFLFFQFLLAFPPNPLISTNFKQKGRQRIGYSPAPEYGSADFTDIRTRIESVKQIPSVPSQMNEQLKPVK